MNNSNDPCTSKTCSEEVSATLLSTISPFHLLPLCIASFCSIEHRSAYSVTLTATSSFRPY